MQEPSSPPPSLGREQVMINEIVPCANEAKSPPPHPLVTSHDPK